MELVLQYSLWEWRSALGGKTHGSVRYPSFSLGPQFWTLRTGHREPPATPQSRVRHPFPCTGACPGFCSWPPSWEHESLLASGSLQASGCSLHSAFPFLMNLRRCWFFTLLSFLLIVRAEWQLPRFLHARPETVVLLWVKKEFLKMFEGTPLTHSYLFSGVSPEMF